jgi:hypothetical protein
MIRCAAVPLPGWPPPPPAQVPATFPATALRGELVVTQPPDVLLNGKPARLAPGARIRNEDNRFEVSGALAGGQRWWCTTRSTCRPAAGRLDPDALRARAAALADHAARPKLAVRPVASAGAGHERQARRRSSSAPSAAR